MIQAHKTEKSYQSQISITFDIIFDIQMFVKSGFHKENITSMNNFNLIWAQKLENRNNKKNPLVRRDKKMGLENISTLPLCN